VSPDPDNPSLCIIEGNARQIGDIAIVAFLKIMGDININQKITKYRNHEGLTKRMPNYTVKMGFGLHCGWAIEVMEKILGFFTFLGRNWLRI